MKSMEDKELVNKILKGNQSAYGLLITRHQRLVFHIVNRMVSNEQDRQELCQDIFIKVYQTLESFRFQAKLSTWIATVAYRMTINHKKKKDREVPFEDLEKIDFQIGHLPEGYEQQDFTRFIHSIIEQMPANYRIVLTLHYLDGFSGPEIQDITGMPEGTVKNYLFRARAKLKALLVPYVGKEIEI